MFGYTTIGEFIKAIFKHCDTTLYLKYLLPIILFINTVFNFLFQSVGGIWFLILLYIMDFVSGVVKAISYSLKAKNLKSQGLQVPEEIASQILVSKKFPRFLFTMLAALVLLSILKFAGIFSIIFTPLYSIFYAVFLGQQIISIVENFGEMKLIPIDVVNKIKRKINDLKK